MNKKIIFVLLLLLPVAIMAAGGESRYFEQTGRHTDFFPRAFNFVIFVGLLYYLLASPVKDFFVGRKEGIAAQLNEIESKLQEAKDAQKNAENELVESEIKAKEIIEDSKNEAELLAKRLEEGRERDIELLDKLHEERMGHEERRMVKETIDEVLSENITSDDIPLSEKQVVEIIAKKVA
ncbi:MAG: F0F1 ATP synthase subunit B [Sulfurovum sp.]|nr:F0F1 ATP synthase subunit B [Sulfurovum sp.]